MRFVHEGIAGTMESGDIYIELTEGGGAPGIAIELDSSVGSQFGKRIREVITQTLAECGVETACVRAVDHGALDCTIRARVTAAALRGADETEYTWR